MHHSVVFAVKQLQNAKKSDIIRGLLQLLNIERKA